MEALRRADAAGDVQAAQAIARRLAATPQDAPGRPVAAPVGPSPAPAAQAAPEGVITAESGPLEKFRLGLANTGIETYLGAKQLFTDLDPEEMSVLKQSRSDVDKGGGWGTAGRITGGIGEAVAMSMMAPAKLAQTMAALRGAAPIATAAASSGLQSAALTPIEDQENKWVGKLEEGGKAALTGAALTGGGKLLKKALTRPVTPTDDAVMLMQNKVYPTLQQGAKNKVMQVVGGLTAGGKGVEERQGKELLDAITQRAMPGLDANDFTLRERQGVLNDLFDAEYRGVLDNKKFVLSNPTRQAVMGTATGLEKSGGRFKKEAGDAFDILSNIIGKNKNTVRMNSDTLRKDYLDAIQGRIGPQNDRKVNDALIEAKNILIEQVRNNKLSPEELDAISSLDSRWFDFSRLKDVARSAQAAREGVNVGKIASAYNAADPMAKQATHRELIEPAFRTLIGNESEVGARGALLNWRRATGLGTLGAGAAAGTAVLGAPTTGAILAPVYGTSLLGQTKGGARYLFGDYNWQKAARDALESEKTKEASMANIIRALRDNSSGYGAALTIGE
jgi:hypothetical protein